VSDDPPTRSGLNPWPRKQANQPELLTPAGPCPAFDAVQSRYKQKLTVIGKC
jgi:hypothetical protein